MLLSLMRLLSESCLLTEELLKFVEVAYHLHWIFAAVVLLVRSLKSYTPTGSKFLKVKFS